VSRCQQPRPPDIRLIKLKYGSVVDIGNMGKVLLEGDHGFFQKAEEFKNNPNTLFEVEGKIKCPFTNIYSFEIILE